MNAQSAKSVPLSDDRGRTVRLVGGMTLIEVLVVLTLIGAISAFGVAMMRKQDKGLMLDTGSRVIRSSLRIARNSARKSGSGAIVRISPEDRSIQAFPVDIAGNWHFEDDTGAYGRRIQGGVPIIEGGFLGKCAKSQGAAIDLGDYPNYDSRDGFRFSVWLKIDRPASGTIVSRAKSFRLGMNEGGALTAELQVGDQNESLRMETRPGIVTPGKWMQVAIAYDRVEFTIEAQNVVFARQLESRPTARAQGNLILGGGVPGAFDEARFDVVVAEQEETLKGRVAIDAKEDIIVRFDSDGRLDRRRHSKPVRVKLIIEDEPERSADVFVDFAGVVQ